MADQNINPRSVASSLPEGGTLYNDLDPLKRINAAAYIDSNSTYWPTLQAALSSLPVQPFSSRNVFANRAATLSSLTNPVLLLETGTYANGPVVVGWPDGTELIVRQFELSGAGKGLTLGSANFGTGRLVAQAGQPLIGNLRKEAALFGLDFGSEPGGVVNVYDTSSIGKVTGVGTIYLQSYQAKYIGTPPEGVNVVEFAGAAGPTAEQVLALVDAEASNVTVQLVGGKLVLTATGGGGGGETPTTYALENGQFFDNGLNLAKAGYTVRNPYSYVRFPLPDGVTTFDVQVVADLPYTSLRQIGVKANGAFRASIQVERTPTPTWYTVSNLPAGSIVEVVSGYLEKLPGGDYTGVLLTAVRVAGSITFALPAAPTRRAVLYGDSILTGAFATDPQQNAAVSRARQALAADGYRTTVEAYSARQLADDYEVVANRPALIARISAMLDGSAENVFYSEIGTNDRGVGNRDIGTIQTMYAALVDDLHTARPSVRIILQVPTLRIDAGSSWITDLQTAVADLATGRAWLEILTSAVTTSELYQDGLHLNDDGHELVGQEIINKVRGSGGAYTGVFVQGVTPVEENNGKWIKSNVDWQPDSTPLYSGGLGAFCQNGSIRALDFRLASAGYFIISTISGPGAGVLTIGITGRADTTADLGTGPLTGSHPVYTSAQLPAGDYTLSYSGSGTVTCDLITFYLGTPPA